MLITLHIFIHTFFHPLSTVLVQDALFDTLSTLLQFSPVWQSHDCHTTFSAEEAAFEAASFAETPAGFLRIFVAGKATTKVLWTLSPSGNWEWRFSCEDKCVRE
ncbi:hypothetical protein A3A39_01145 [Candidatus Kaiserbacteria bacterium RIFCSPLOWO2_01_FULL_54_13]|uniref:Uncharacterized protein n=1 Tax=Candidatus Kaiserbacteria bacterium RIFCSPLOWO2_01_FULL_54_13 TaxID=1798512 RepID=A0A1F6F2B0_9BACT|nr:MAG: hypothetical protein A3A39_01145 [Candidatus Kaiserbacteria bacterium RIFCSPLOWO2_01_FULL_54_13]